MDFASLMEQRLLRERRYGERRSHSKTRSLGDGKTADIFEVWESFDQEVEIFWSEYRPRLTQVNCGNYPRRGMSVGIITEETDIRECFSQCIGQPVSDAARAGLGENLIFASAASVGVSNADVGGFITKSDAAVQEQYVYSSDETSSEDGTHDDDTDFQLDDEVVPVEVKPPWQVHLRRRRNVVHMMLLDDEKIHVRSALSQIFLYMVLEESKYGILTTKDRSVFLRYSLDGSLKRLEASRTVCYNDHIGIRKCFLFMLMKAKVADRCPLSQTWTTPESEKWIPPKRNKRQSPFTRDKMKRFASTRKAARTSGRGRGRGGTGQTSRRVCDMEVEGEEKEATQRSEEEEVISLTVDHPWEGEKLGSVGKQKSEEECMVWAKSLKQIDIGDLHLFHVIKKGGGHKVWKGEMGGHEVAIKFFDFCENLDDLEYFFNEVCMYLNLAHVQGTYVPYLLDYGLTWGGFVGFLAMSCEGLEVDCKELSTSEKQKLLSTLRCIHKLGIVHGDLRFSNLLHGRMTGKFVLIDFEHSKFASSSEEIQEEMTDFRALLKLQK